MSEIVDWAALQSEAIEYRNSKGFVAVAWESAATRLGCVMKEIHEVERALGRLSLTAAAGSFDTHEEYLELEVRRELADVALYVLTIQRDLGQDFDFTPGTARLTTHVPRERFTLPEAMTRHLRTYWAHSFDAWQHRNVSDFRIAMDMLLAHAVALHQQLFPEIGFANTCREKLALMANRTLLHGGKDPKS